jgi:NTE family protein
MANGQALVLGGGGVAGIAWMTGLLAGLADAGQDVTGADEVIGTSAGANVAAQLGSGLSLAELLARQVEPALQSRELMAVIDWARFAAEIEPYLAGASTPAEQLRNFGRFALDADTVPETKRIAVIESRLPSREWPLTPTRLTAVDCVSGELTVFDEASAAAIGTNALDPATRVPAATAGRAQGRAGLPPAF